jgi:subtilisin family serine protease
MDWSCARIIYVHGSGNQKLAHELKLDWDTCLFQKDMGDRTCMAYYVNRDRHPVPEKDSSWQPSQAILVSQQTPAALIASKPISDRDQVKAWVDASQRSIPLKFRQAIEENDLDELTKIYSALNSRDKHPTRRRPGAQSKKIFDSLVLFGANALFPDAIDFLCQPNFRNAACQQLVDRIEESGDRPIAIISHSLGSMVAHEVLRRYCDQAKPPQIAHWFTLGSPLGLNTFRRLMSKWADVTDSRLTFAPFVNAWTNICDTNDLAGGWDADLRNDINFGTHAASDYRNLSEAGLNASLGAHVVRGYLKNPQVQQTILPAIGGSLLMTQLADRHLAAPLMRQYLRTQAHERLPVLLEIEHSNAIDMSLAQARDSLVKALKKVLGKEFAQAQVDPLRHYVSANLTQEQLRRVLSLTATQTTNAYKVARVAGTPPKVGSVRRVWQNAAKRALITDSIHTLQAETAQLGYGARGKDITWAVIDTGVSAAHPHFALNNNLTDGGWDCTVRGEAKALPKTFIDKNGHGSHVAGIIAGEYQTKKERALLKGMAPMSRIVALKALDDAGYGNDAWTIKAIEKIESLNEAAGRLVIQGVNLSLGGNYERDAYGCGHTPVCTALRRLWRQGVVVVIAAGNEGTVPILDAEGEFLEASFDLSIGDPANLEDAICVGSVHKRNPHTYGVSHFSSRGPTVDGRVKPDCVAPGERILSALGQFSGSDMDGLYVSLSGTSMAAPHVSGLLAAFLSARPEFIGEPDKLKKILLSNCTDLSRDRYFQGAGLPNLAKMLIST